MIKTWITRKLKNNSWLCVSRGFLSRPCSKAGPAWFKRGVRSLRTPWKSSSQRTRCYESPTTCAGAEDASRVFVATDLVPQVADDTQEQPGACGRCVIDRTRRHHCWFGHSWTIFWRLLEVEDLVTGQWVRTIFLEDFTRSWFEGGTLRGLWSNKQVKLWNIWVNFAALLKPLRALELRFWKG